MTHHITGEETFAENGVQKGRIRILDPDVIDQIAAGEVVERPASVLKELVENALDAQADSISVTAEGGGITSIEVSDNGVGMGADDAVLAVKRHATSKISGIEDLERIRSLGFRGEALSSIASVGRLELVSRLRDSLEGIRVVVEGANVIDVSPHGCPPGTRIRVEDLFYNVPARRKFLRTLTTEAQHLKNALERAAMIRPGIRFEYSYEGRRTIECVPTGDGLERVGQIWGKDAYENLYPVSMEEDGLTVEGYLSHPNHHKASASWIWFYVNERHVLDRGLLHAILRGYGPLMERGRYPVGYIHIRMRPEEADVNVHPAKREIRFRNARMVQGAVVGAVKRLLREQPWVPDIGGASAYSGVSESAAVRQSTIAEPAGSFSGREAERVPFFDRGFRSPTPYSKGSTGIQKSLLRFDVDDERTDEILLHETIPENIRFLGQFEGTYLLFAAEGGILVVDQHAAHERILFERLRSGLEGGSNVGSAQTVLWSEIIELNAIQADRFDRMKGAMSALGLEIEPFGNNSFRLRTVPAWMEPEAASQVIKDILDSDDDMTGESRWERFESNVLSKIACHRALRAKTAMNETEALTLIETMRKTHRSGLCPHGRPTVLRISVEELKKRFGRT